MKSKAFKLSLIALAAAILSSCNTDTYKNINYLQDVDSYLEMQSDGYKEGILVQPKDQISIVVSSRNPELAVMFNLVNVTYQAGSEMGAGGVQRLMGYVVNDEGNIDFPVIGSLHVAGLNRWQVGQLVKDELQNRNLLKDPVVTVEFMNFKISVLGEVKSPGTFNVVGDKINLLEALSRAGDLTIYGKRDNVRVIREYGGKRTVYLADLRSSDLFKSPAYYLRQNDVVVVEPNRVRAGQSTINENNLRSTSFWLSVSSLLLTITSLIVTITK